LADHGVDKPMKAPNTLRNPNLRPLSMSTVAQKAEGISAVEETNLQGS